MKSSTFEMAVEADLENLSILSEFIARVMREIGADERSLFEVQLAVDEACTNIIQHAYSGEGGTISIGCQLADDSLVVTIRDQGKPFDPNSIPPPDLGAGAGERKVGGLGMFLMTKMMDEVSYGFDAQRGNELTMCKKLRRLK
ncbi:MAG: hypothetical protein A2Y91_01705 [Chloroflexi bacterium RBG_13_54_8]|nr:MAG: hypothetical protein A2Y91_01705 [Chloroflexi bacterium RBG_13_54_8]